jgi:hypothetical protein
MIVNLKIVTAKRREQKKSIIKRRNKLTSKLHDQLELAQVESQKLEYS